MSRRVRTTTIALVFAGAALWACDNGRAPTNRAPQPPSTAPPASLSSGGATVESSEHRVRLVIGGPQPVATSSSEQHSVKLGPADR